MENKIEIEEDLCEHDDKPVTYCPKCKTFFFESKDGFMEEIIIPGGKAYIEKIEE